jgi:probable rRNA maturation factor
MKVEIVREVSGRFATLHLRRFMAWLPRFLPPLRRRRVTIAVVKDSTMRRLNRRYRRKSGVTDVLSFGSVDGESLGELVLCASQVRAQAQEHGLPLRDEYAYLILHGLLHLLGYNHEKGGADARRMYAVQDRLFDLYRDRNARSAGRRRRRKKGVASCHPYRKSRTSSRS